MASTPTYVVTFSLKTADSEVETGVIDKIVAPSPLKVLEILRKQYGPSLKNVVAIVGLRQAGTNRNVWISP